MEESHEKILKIILDQNEITWQTIIYDLINSEQMDPWDIDISLLTAKYIGMIKTLENHDFRVSGKVLLAAALLLKIKSTSGSGKISRIWMRSSAQRMKAMICLGSLKIPLFPGKRLMRILFRECRSQGEEKYQCMIWSLPLKKRWK